MKKQTGIWIDGTKAVVISLQDSTLSTKTLKSKIENRIYHEKEGNTGSFSGKQHLNNEKKFDERKKHQTKEFIKQVCTHLNGSSSLYVFGPAEMKKHLKKAIDADKFLSKAILNIESAEDMSRNQLIAKVKKHYREE